MGKAHGRKQAGLFSFLHLFCHLWGKGQNFILCSSLLPLLLEPGWWEQSASARFMAGGGGSKLSMVYFQVSLQHLGEKRECSPSQPLTCHAAMHIFPPIVATYCHLFHSFTTTHKDVPGGDSWRPAIEASLAPTDSYMPFIPTHSTGVRMWRAVGWTTCLAFYQWWWAILEASGHDGDSA